MPTKRTSFWLMVALVWCWMMMPPLPISSVPKAAGPTVLLEIMLPVFEAVAEPRRKMPQRALVMALFMKVLVSLLAPSLVVLIVLSEERMPKVSEVDADCSTPQAMLQFLTVLPVAPAPLPRLDSQMAAVPAVALVFVIVRLRSVPALSEPSIVTRSAPLSLIKAVVEAPEIVCAAPVGLIVTV